MAWHYCTKFAAGLLRQSHFNWARHSSPVTLNCFRTIHISVNKMAKQLDVSGIFPPIVTPFNDNEDIDYHKLKLNLSRWNEIPFAGEKTYSSRTIDAIRLGFLVLGGIQYISTISPSICLR